MPKILSTLSVLTVRGIIMKINRFSPKQTLAVKWWNCPHYKNYDAIICDGAVRSGKTLSMSVGFISWSMTSFKNHSFAFCGKTITSLRRNVISPLVSILGTLGFTCIEKVSKNYIDIRLCGITNRYYMFGGKDESSASLIQGMTLCGVFFDEVALMPRSFVEQALARCSVENSKMWFNCNPENPYHWFYTEWIKKANEKNALYLHFTMDDNPSLSCEIKERYSRLYSGIFYERFILGKWTVSSGLVYPMIDKNVHFFADAPVCERFVVSCDYGTVNPSSFGLWGFSDGIWYRLKEYYYCSRREGISRTDEEHYNALENLTAGFDIDFVIVDPSAASFIECIKRHGRFSVRKADNDVLSGIRRVSDAIKQKKIMFSLSCKDTLREFSLYQWNEKVSFDVPLKENDHAMDDIRYFVSSVLSENADSNDSFFVLSAERF